MQPQLPARPSFAEMAVCLRECAQHQRDVNEWGGNLFGPKGAGADDLRSPLESMILRVEFAELRRKEQLLFAAHEALKEMSDHEQQIRAVVERRSIMLRAQRVFWRFVTWATTLEPRTGTKTKTA